jgi:hypothetical protein
MGKGRPKLSGCITPDNRENLTETGLKQKGIGKQ